MAWCKYSEIYECHNHSIRRYFKEINRYRILTREEEVDIGRRIEIEEERIQMARKKLEELQMDPNIDWDTLYRICQEIEGCERRSKMAKAEIIRANLKLVVSIAKKYLNLGVYHLAI